MANPTIGGSLNNTSYAVGATMTATITYGDTDQKSGTVTFKITDAEGNVSANLVLPYLIDPLTVSYVDSLGKVWTKISDSGSVAVFTATA